MKSSKVFLLTLILISLLVVFILAFLFSGEKSDIEKIDEVDYTYNILKNSGFETGDLSYWKKPFENDLKFYTFIDDIVKFEGGYSLNISSELDTTHLSIIQELKEFPLDKKLILNARARTEDVRLAFISIELFSLEGKLLAEAISDTLRGTNDWTHITTWVRTINPELTYIVVKCNLRGKGRVWFDKVEMYPVDIEQKTIIPIQK